ncbi:hypothetical protein [Bacillus norwichensis]|uniref:Uncharacterized protein n=1 Tax=Bacillus norwichensis TaxID=2762217 RepID=A0ABR8VQM7_9BACI|nr:hypothetical protein [Bacillus norwichensis]MBD8007073.1 hypothetical protein [Bacillus norwichensis]
MEKIIKKINGILTQINLPPTDAIPEKTLQRLINFEEYASNVEKLNTESIEEIKKRKMTKVSISNSPELNISRKTLYNDKILLKYVEAKIEKQVDYFNEKKLMKLQEQYQELKLQYEKVTDHLLDTSILQAEILQYKEKIEELIQDKNRLYMMLQKYEK